MTTVLSLTIAIVFTTTVPAFAEGNNCTNKEISVSNQVAVNLWYKRDGGNCSLLNKHNIFLVFPGEGFQIYSDSTCKTKYCSGLIHEDFKSFDRDGDCRVRILTGCILSDM